MQKATFDAYHVPHCPSCKAKQPSPDNRWCYGSPLRRCPNCGTDYIDDRYREIAIDGYIPNALSPIRSLTVSVIGLIIVMLGILMRRLEINSTGSYHTITIAIAGLGAVMFIVGLEDLISIITGSKRKKLEKLKAESMERMKNAVYVQSLINAGINVPKEYCPQEDSSDFK